MQEDAFGKLYPLAVIENKVDPVVHSDVRLACSGVHLNEEMCHAATACGYKAAISMIASAG